MKKRQKDPRLQQINGPEYWQQEIDRRSLILALAREWIDGKVKLDAEEQSTLRSLVYQFGPADLVLEFYHSILRVATVQFNYSTERLAEFEYDLLLVVLQKFPFHGKSQDRLLEICLMLGKVPDHYWDIFYAHSQQRVGKAELPDYARRIGQLVQAVERARGDADLKAAELVRLRRFHGFLARMIPDPVPGDPYLDADSYAFEAIFLSFMQVRCEGNLTEAQILEDATHWLAVLELENDFDRPRHPIPFQRLTVEKIDFATFLGRPLPAIGDGEDIYGQWGRLSGSNLGGELLWQMFEHPYRPKLEDFPFFTEGMTEAEVRSLAIQKLLEDYLGISLEEVREEKIGFYSLSTNTSHVFDAGHEWMGARFWAIYHPEKEILSFLIASMTD